ncbi:MAG: hypothetical protein ACRERC_19890 [Candidatus Binatia bacterium]
MRTLIWMLVVAMLAAPVSAADGTPSVKEGVEEVGEAIKDGAVTGYDKTKDATKKGVGTALEKTGEGFDKAAEGLQDAGEKVEHP